MDDTISRAEALNLVKDVCNAILSGCGSHYDGEDEVYDDLLEVDAILKCNKEIRIALKHLPSAQPVKDARAMCGECDAWNQYKNYPQPGWIPWDSGKFPGESGYYTVTAYDGTTKRVTHAKYQKRLKRWELTGARAYWRVLAWLPPIEPWEGEGDG